MRAIESMFLNHSKLDGSKPGDGTTTPETSNTGSITPRTTSEKVEYFTVKDLGQILSFQERLKVRSESIVASLKEIKDKLRVAGSSYKDLAGQLPEIPSEQDIEKQRIAIDSIDKLQIKVSFLDKKLVSLTAQIGKIQTEVSGNAMLIVPYQKDLSTRGVFDDQSPRTIRYAINSSAVPELTGIYLDKEMLHPIEEALFGSAFVLLENVRVEAGNEEQYLNNIVLVDFFVRDDDKIKKYKETEAPETHTVALWKKTNSEYILIDPSNTKFSTFLVPLLNKLNVMQGKKISELPIEGGILYGPGKEPTGYSSPLQLQKPRDCTDIAVKIAFELNEQQNKIPFPSAEYDFLKSEGDDELFKAAKMMVFTLTNQTPATIHSSLITNPSTRDAQSTDPRTRNGALLAQVKSHRPAGNKPK
ncbi:MAG: hypothetical protein JKY54_11855 [Flavobacteriales bacterium]|nr:hypothetical protein [Flavobacteriales bacterium]